MSGRNKSYILTKIAKAWELLPDTGKHIIMKTTDPRKNEKKTPPDMDIIPRELPPQEPAIEEYIDEESDWSEDKSEYDKHKKR